MRELGTLIWVVLIIVGVVSSMISTVRKQSQGQRPQGQRPQPQPGFPISRPPPPPSVPPPVPPPPPAASKRQSAPAPEPPPIHAFDAPHPKRRPFLAGRGQLVRAVIAAEVLGKPLGLRDEHFPR